MFCVCSFDLKFCDSSLKCFVLHIINPINLDNVIAEELARVEDVAGHGLLPCPLLSLLSAWLLRASLLSLQTCT